MKLLITLSVFFLLSCKFHARISKVIDGDSYYLSDHTEVRILYVDCAEATRGHFQPFGIEATQYSRKYLEGQEVVLKSHGRDKYHRLLCEIWLPDGRYFNEMLVKDGMAYVYKKYAPRYLYNEEQEAKRNKIGLWAYQNEPPFIFRKNYKQKKPKK